MFHSKLLSPGPFSQDIVYFLHNHLPEVDEGILLRSALLLLLLDVLSLFCFLAVLTQIAAFVFLNLSWLFFSKHAALLGVTYSS